MAKEAKPCWKLTPRQGMPAGFMVGSILALAGPTNIPMLVLGGYYLSEIRVLQVCTGCHSTAVLPEHRSRP